MNKASLMILFFILAFIICGQISNPRQTQIQVPEEKKQKSYSHSGDAFKNASLTYKLIPGINSTWGYDILVDGRLTIHQPSVPALPGNEGFKTRDGAEKVARLVIWKMKKGEMPPSIDPEEIKKLKAI